MGKFGFGLVVLYASSIFCYGGTATYSSDNKEMMEGPPPPCWRFRPGEWEFSFWGAAASPSNELRDDRYLNRGTAWGGGVDIKYFFTKSIGLGLEGIALDARDNVAGGGLATFTYRYPIGCSRFAPYAWAGLGATAGGTQRSVDTTDVNLTGQIGVGLQFRYASHAGFMADYVWNFLERRDNDFGMVRFGVTLAY